MASELVILLVVSIIGNVVALLKHIKTIKTPCCNVICQTTPRISKNDNDNKALTMQQIAKAYMPSSSETDKSESRK